MILAYISNFAKFITAPNKNLIKMAKPIEVDFEHFIPSLQQFVAYYDVMKGLGLIENVKVEMDESEGPLITINSNITQEASKLYG